MQRHCACQSARELAANIREETHSANVSSSARRSMSSLTYSLEVAILCVNKIIDHVENWPEETTYSHLDHALAAINLVFSSGESRSAWYADNMSCRLEGSTGAR